MILDALDVEDSSFKRKVAINLKVGAGAYVLQVKYDLTKSN